MYKATAAAAALPPVQKKLNLFHILINQCEFFIRVQGCFLGTKAPEELSSEPGTETPPPSSAGGVDTVCQVLEIHGVMGYRVCAQGLSSVLKGSSSQCPHG